MKKLFIACIAMFCSGLAISACGQKGPLFLPGNPSEVQSEVPRQDQPENEEEEESDADNPD